MLPNYPFVLRGKKSIEKEIFELNLSMLSNYPFVLRGKKSIEKEIFELDLLESTLKKV